ncbi:putative porin [Carboxylicivirga sp. A043]|uniref:putative porin n=1 Tax=Carboxylicivirga litoralis TaxID=2816963 RepID=UPI0021CB46F3|nr:putative porin [Carboxylicivirga sp. A043]MCU4156062.1 putative porin [Carboxylicivirga sp. A043]
MTFSFNKYLLTLIISLLFVSYSSAQRKLSSGGPDQMGMGQGDGQMGEGEQPQGDFIPPDVNAWKLRDHFTFSDTVAVDTMSNGYQIYNPIFKKSIAQNWLGNMNSANQSMIFDEQEKHYGYLFYNSFLTYIPQPHEIYFYNTKTPYVNLTYHFGGPKRRSEEAISALYTQNINKHFNVGLQYQLNSSIGLYQGQKAENQNFKFWSSYNGKRYNMHMAFIYAKIENQENGGINLTGAENKFNDLEPDEIPVHFQTAYTKINNLQFFYNHSLSIGNISVQDKDSTINELPVSTIFHTLKFDQGKREYQIDDLESYYITDSPYYPNIYRDSLQTRDSTLYNNLVNTFQIKFNEEANSLLRFGLRAYITNDIMYYKFPGQTTYGLDDENKGIINYQTRDTTLVNSAIGGQIFKNLGKNFWWNAGLKFYFQGYRAGDSEITGNLNSQFRIHKDTAGFFANGGIYLRQPELFENQYFSNHLQWKEDFNQVKSVRIRGGIRIPTRRIEISGGANIVTEHIYWNASGLPIQTSTVVQVLSARLKKHFKLGRIHSVNDIIAQYTSHDEYIPVPKLALYNSTYYQNTLFKVLHFQIGFDARYNSKYYAPMYMPATGQFVNQRTEKVGDYPFIDVFANFQLKRARIYVKFDHVNEGYPNEPYYTSYQYPGNPRSLKFGVSWNFYD